MLHPPKSSEPIPGYVLKERIGVGGYGEVWSAGAPGGLAKAIKFVYGYFDDARAARELKALDRIKQVRHPFLLSLERFEIVDGQLIIVTELADMSLKDRFEKAKESGLDGIPRDELLNYMRDAADALDYMSENFSLQHLDVKPENLLLVGGRVKVADFGLVKNVHEVTASMMGGLTPIYAAPEVFDDRPSKHSDQYSLAIVYQEMLTGNLPFPGRTPAQLASQHLHASPRLAMLPADDQLVIAQALSKNPVARLANCRSMVDALLAADAAARARKAPARVASEVVSPTSDTTSQSEAAAKTDTDAPPADSNGKTQVLGSARDSSAARLTGSSQAPPVEPIVMLEPLDASQAARELRPTLFLGIGGTAGTVLSRLRRRLADRFGPAASVPAIRTLVVDTDSKSLFSAAGNEREAALGDGDLMPLAIRTAHDYTANARNMMQWLSRRWLYNIPRSLQTEGRRPLGRLALVDHAPELIARLRGVIQQMTDAEAISASAAATGQAFTAEAPRVFVVASISGGTGGGMALDVAYAVRQVLADLGHATTGVCQILAHSTDRNPSAAELATANAYVCLSELQHYGLFGYTPGDPGCGLPGGLADRAALGNTYFVHLGHGLNDHEFAAAADVLASYLYASAATSAAGVFDLSRSLAPADEQAPSLSSFSLATIGSMHTPLAALTAQLVCREIVDRWRGAVRDRREAPPKSSLDQIAMQRMAPAEAGAPTEIAVMAAEHAAGLDLAVEPLREKLAALVEKRLGGDADTVFARLSTMIDGQRPDAKQRTPLVLEAIRGLFDPLAVSEEVQKPAALELHASIEQALKPLAAPRAAVITEWILRFVNDPAARVAGALQARQWYAAHLRDLESECADLLKDFQHNLQALEQTLALTEKAAPSRGRMFGARKAEKKHHENVDELLLLIVQLRIGECTLHAVCRFVRLVAAGVAAAGDQLKDQQHVLGQWAAEFDGPSPWQDVSDAAAAATIVTEVRAAVAARLRERLDEMVQNVERRFQDSFLEPQGGLRSVCERADAVQKALLETLRAEARGEVLSVLKQIAIDEAILGGDVEARSERLRACLDAARARFTDCGGTQRLIAVVPAGSSPALGEAFAALDPPATVATDADADLVVCYEQQGLSLAHVAARLIDGRSDIIQIANRLHTRMDVPWSQLPQPSHKPLPTNGRA